MKSIISTKLKLEAYNDNIMHSKLYALMGAPIALIFVENGKFLFSTCHGHSFAKRASFSLMHA